MHIALICSNYKFKLKVWSVSEQCMWFYDAEIKSAHTSWSEDNLKFDSDGGIKKRMRWKESIDSRHSMFAHSH